MPNEVVGRAEIKVSADTRTASQQINSLGSQIQKNFGAQALGSTLVAGFQAATVAGAALLATTIKLGASYNALGQQSVVAFESILGSRDAAEDLLGVIVDIARTSPFSREVFIAGTRQLAAFGVEAAKIPDLLNAIQLQTAAIGGSDAVFTQITRVFAEIQSAGRITGEELRQFRNVGVDAAGLIAEAFGVTAEQMRDQITSGAVDAEMALEGLTKAIEGRFTGSIEEFLNTFEGASLGIRAVLRDIGSALVNPFIGFIEGGALTIAFRDLRTQLRQFIEVGSDGTTRLIGALAPLEDISESLAEKFSNMASALIGAINTDNVNAISDLIGRFEGLERIMASLAAGFLTPLISGLPILSSVIGGLKPLPVMVATLVAMSPELRAMFADLGEKLLPVAVDLFEAFARSLDVVIDAVVMLSPLISGLASIIAAIPSQLIAVAGGFYALNRGLAPAAAGIGKLLPGLAGLAGAATLGVAAVGALAVGFLATRDESQALTTQISDFGKSLLGVETSAQAFEKRRANIFESLYIDPAQLGTVDSMSDAVSKLRGEYDSLMTAVESRPPVYFGFDPDRINAETIEEMLADLDKLADAQIKAARDAGTLNLSLLELGRLGQARKTPGGVVDFLDQISLRMSEGEAKAAEFKAEMEELTRGTQVTSEAFSQLINGWGAVPAALRGLSEGTVDTVTGFTNLIIALGNAGLEGQAFSDVANALGLDVEELQGLLDSASEAVYDFAKSAADALPTVGSVFKDTMSIFEDENYAGGKFVETLRSNLEASTLEIMAFTQNLREIEAAGFVNIAGELALLGPEQGLQASQEVLDMVGTVNETLLRETEDTVASFNAAWQDAYNFFSGELGPAFIFQSQFMSEMMSEAFSDNLDISEAIRLNQLLATETLTTEQQNFVAAYAAMGEDALTAFDGEFDGIDQMTKDRLMEMVDAIRTENQGETEAKKWGKRTADGLGSSFRTGVEGWGDRASKAIQKLLRTDKALAKAASAGAALGSALGSSVSSSVSSWANTITSQINSLFGFAARGPGRSWGAGGDGTFTSDGTFGGNLRSAPPISRIPTINSFSSSSTINVDVSGLRRSDGHEVGDIVAARVQAVLSEREQQMVARFAGTRQVT